MISRVPNPPPRPVLIYDDQCPFCRQWAGRWRRTLGHWLDFADLRPAAKRFAIPQAQFEASVHLIEPDGAVYWGAQAVFRARAHAPGFWRRAPLWVYEKIPGANFFAELVYKGVANSRNLLFHLTRWLG